MGFADFSIVIDVKHIRTISFWFTIVQRLYIAFAFNPHAITYRDPFLHRRYAEAIKSFFLYFLEKPTGILPTAHAAPYTAIMLAKTTRGLRRAAMVVAS